MASLIFRRGNRLFATGSILLLVTAGLHTIGWLSGPPDDQALLAVLNVMSGYRFDLGLGMRPTVTDIHYSLAHTMGILITWLGLQNLLTLAVAGDNKRLVRVLVTLNVLGLAGLVALYTVYRVPPPLVSLAVVELLFVLALIVPEPRAVQA
jgi:hypothetical protein